MALEKREGLIQNLGRHLQRIVLAVKRVRSRKDAIRASKVALLGHAERQNVDGFLIELPHRGFVQHVDNVPRPVIGKVAMRAVGGGQLPESATNGLRRVPVLVPENHLLFIQNSKVLYDVVLDRVHLEHTVEIYVVNIIERRGAESQNEWPALIVSKVVHSGRDGFGCECAHRECAVVIYDGCSDEFGDEGSANDPV
jgi:hypothetical protein